MLIIFSMAFGVLPSIPSAGQNDVVRIMGDGSISPATAPIQRNGDTYTLTGDIDGSLIVERNNTILDGAGFTLQGTGDVYTTMDKGVTLVGIENVVIRNMEIRAFWCGIYLDLCQNVRIVGNTITNGSENTRGIYLSQEYWAGGYSWPSHNAVIRNNITEQGTGISIRRTGNNSIFENNLTDNDFGLDLSEADYNLVVGNNIMRNSKPWNGEWWDTAGIGVMFYDSTHNTFYHNNFVDNDEDLHLSGGGDFPFNVWNESYPSGGNYWGCYTGADSNGDGFGDSSYYLDNYPLMNPWSQSGIHDLYASLQLGVIETLGRSTWLNATATNQGSVDEVNVSVSMTVDNSTVESFVLPQLKSGESHMFGHLWTPATKGLHNVTISTTPVSGEVRLDNNGELKTVTIYEIGVDAGDWITYAYSYNVTPETVHTEWVKVEILTVVTTTVTIRGTLHLSNGTELSEVYSDTITGEGMTSMVFDTLSGFVVPANSTVGDMFWIGYKIVYDSENDTFDSSMRPCPSIRDTGSMTGSGAEETEGEYVNMTRTVLRASWPTYIFPNGPITCYWDRQTGILLEMSCVRDGWSAKAVETNILHPISPIGPDSPHGGALDPVVLYALVTAAIVMVAAVAFLMTRRKKEPELLIPDAEEPPTAPPGT